MKIIYVIICQNTEFRLLVIIELQNRGGKSIQICTLTFSSLIFKPQNKYVVSRKSSKCNKSKQISWFIDFSLIN